MDTVPARGARRPSRPEVEQIPQSGNATTPHHASRFAVKALSRPATAFTGDFYFAVEVEGLLWFAVGDFAGHGLRAAVFMAMMQEELFRLIRSCSSADPAEVVASLDCALRGVIPFNRFATLVIGRELPDGSLQLVNAGHCFPFVVRSNGQLDMIGSHGPVVGLGPSPSWKQQSVRLATGERLVVYTDGLIEAESEDGSEFGAGRLGSLIGRLPHADVLDGVFDEVARFTNGRQEDDRTLFVLKAL